MAYFGTTPRAQTGLSGQTAERMTRLSPLSRMVGTRIIRLSRVDSPFGGGSDGAMLYRSATSTDVSASITSERIHQRLGIGDDVVATAHR